jgi:hypothetical protein
MKNFALLTLIIWSMNSNKPGLSYRQSLNDSVVISWNKATLASIKRQIAEAKDSLVKTQYENRLEAEQIHDAGSDEMKINFHSLRFEFVKFLANINFNKMDFYIIEANSSGAKVIMRNYVVYRRSTDDVHVDVYIFGIRGWFKQAEVKNLAFNLVDGFEGAHVKHGFNEDDIIVTKFEDDTVKYSEYFLDGTLSKSSAIRVILNTDNTKNFVK